MRSRKLSSEGDHTVRGDVHGHVIALGQAFTAWIAVPGKDKGPAYWRAYCSKQDVTMIQLGISPTDEELVPRPDPQPKGQGGSAHRPSRRQEGH